MEKETGKASAGSRIIRDEDVLALARARGETAEEALFRMMRKCPVAFGATCDWEDFGSISIAVMRELKPYKTYQAVYNLVLRVFQLYDTQVISVLRVFSDVERLAYFVNEMIETMLEVSHYRDALSVEYGVDTANKIALRGIVLFRITSVGVRNVFKCENKAFFRAESFCARKLIAREAAGAQQGTGLRCAA